MSKMSLAVEKAAARAAVAVPFYPANITGPGDLRDQHWLDARCDDIRNGIEAVTDIARNWSDGRNLARLFPGVSAADYITSRIGTLGKSVIPVLLAESNWSNRQIAAVAGVDERSVRRTAANAAVDRPAETLGADGKVRDYGTPRTVIAEVIDHPSEATARAIAARESAMAADPDVAQAGRQRAWNAVELRLTELVMVDPAEYVPDLEGDDLAELPGLVASVRRWLDSIEAAHAAAVRPRLVGGAS